MAPSFTIVCFLFLVTEILIGTLANGSIVFISFIDWLRSRKLSPTDLILICLSLSRLLQQVVVITDVTEFIFHNNPMSNNIQSSLLGIWIYTKTANICFAACLSVFYLAKIAVFSHPVFLQVKQRAPGLVPQLLVGSVVLSTVVTITVTTSWEYDFFACNLYKSLLSNRSNTEMGKPSQCRHMTILIWLFDFIPLMVFLSSSILLISSLLKHMRRVQGNGTGTRDLNTQAHLSAIKALASFAVLYLVSFAVDISQTVLAWTNQRTWAHMLYTLSALYPSGHAIILILINPKLKQVWVRIIDNLKCCLSKIPS